MPALQRSCNVGAGAGLAVYPSTTWQLHLPHYYHTHFRDYNYMSDVPNGIFSRNFFYSFPINKGNILQLSPLVKRSHWQLCSEVKIWDLHGLDWRHRGNSISAFTIILTFDITITGSMYKKGSFYQSIMWQLSSSWLDLKKVKLWLIEFPTAHRLMSLSLSGNVHSAYCQKRFPAIWLCVLGRVKGWVLYKII